MKQYRLLRQKALRDLGFGSGDAFHNTKSVLPEVTRWHQYLRTCTRTQDDYTAKVLDVVDRSMLITPGERRISGSDLHASLSEIHESAMRQPNNRPEPPGDILEFLDEVLASTGDDNPPTLEDIPRTISQSGADMFKEALLYRSLRSDGRRPLPRHTGLLQTRFERPPPIDVHRRSSYEDTSLPSRPVSGSQVPNLPRITTVLSSDETLGPVNPPITFWEVEAELEQQNKGGIIRSLGRRISPNSKLMKGRDDQLAKYFVNRDIVSLSTHHVQYCGLCRHCLP